MKKGIFLFLLVPVLAQAQRWHINVLGGISNYSGDLQANAYTSDQADAGFGVGATYDITHHFSMSSTLSYLQVGASDKYNRGDLKARNLSFETKILEVNLLAEYNFIDLSVHRFTPYLFAGVAAFHFNPYAFDSLGNKVYLRPLSTEGEGLGAYPSRPVYDLFQFAIPVGGGIKLRVADNITLGLELGFRKTFTDYLDDVSTTYVDRATLLAERGPQAVEMAYRGGELKNGAAYPVDGTMRGSSKYKDLYYFTAIKVSVTLFAHGAYGRGSIECPRNVN